MCRTCMTEEQNQRFRKKITMLEDAYANAASQRDSAIIDRDTLIEKIRRNRDQYRNYQSRELNDVVGEPDDECERCGLIWTCVCPAADEHLSICSKAIGPVEDCHICRPKKELE